MLAPVPPPKRVLSSWPEAVTYLQLARPTCESRSTRSSQAEARRESPSRSTCPACLVGLMRTSSSPRAASTSSSAGASSQHDDDVTGNLQLQQTLVNFSSSTRSASTSSSEDATKLSVDDKKRTLALSLANPIVAVVTAERSADINRVGLRVALEQLEITSRKQALGAANGLDVVRAQQNAANARATLVSGRRVAPRGARGARPGPWHPRGDGGRPRPERRRPRQSAMESCRVVRTSTSAPTRGRAHDLDVAKRNLHNVYYQFAPDAQRAEHCDRTSRLPPRSATPDPDVEHPGGPPDAHGSTAARATGTYERPRGARTSRAQTLESLRRQAIIQIDQAQRGLEVAAGPTRWPPSSATSRPRTTR